MLDRHRPILLVATIAACLVLGVVSAFGDLSVYEKVAYPLVAVFLLGVIVALMRGSPGPRSLLHAIFWVGGATWVGLLAFRLFAPLDALPAGQRLSPDLFLVFVALSVIVFVVFPTREAVRVSAVLFATTVAIGAAWALQVVTTGGDSIHVGRFALYQGLYASIVAMLVILARSKDEHAKTMLDAQRFRELAYADPVTGLPNRRKLDERIEQAVAMAERYGTPLAVVLADLDRFKAVNDTHGHDLGDRVLQRFGEVVQGELRASDDFGRWGGEEFVILAPHTDGDEAAALAERIRARVEEHLFPADVRITSSFGVATHDEAASVRDLIRRADERLYAAKEAGRNRVFGWRQHRFGEDPYALERAGGGLGTRGDDACGCTS